MKNKIMLTIVLLAVLFYLGGMFTLRETLAESDIIVIAEPTTVDKATFTITGTSGSDYVKAVGNIIIISNWRGNYNKKTGERVPGPFVDGSGSYSGWSIGVGEPSGDPERMPAVYRPDAQPDWNRKNNDQTIPCPKLGKVTISTLGGNDQIDVSQCNANMVIDAGEGEDVVFTGGGSDKITLNSGNDRAKSGKANDIICGGEGDDGKGVKLDGELGADSIMGETGTDYSKCSYTQKDHVEGNADGESQDSIENIVKQEFCSNDELPTPLTVCPIEVTQCPPSPPRDTHPGNPKPPRPGGGVC